MKLPNSPWARLGQVIPWLFQPLRWLRLQVRRPLRIERRGIHIHIFLGEPVQPAADEPGHGGGEALRRAHAELRQLLGRHDATSRVLRHLAFVERALRKSGSGAFRELPLSVLHRGLAQLNSLALEEKGEGIAELRRRLGHAIEARTRDPIAPGADPDSTVDVSEASHSLFDEMERSWTGQVPASGAGASASA